MVSHDLQQPLQSILGFAQLLEMTYGDRPDDEPVNTVETLPILSGNSTQLTQLFQNLLSNALKYHPPQHVPQITVSAEARATMWRFSVHDNGIGIDPADAEAIFKIFTRLHSKQEYPGTGIGLAICKKIVESHGGRIWVAPKTAVGSTFHFTLPALESDRP